ncbi:DNA repair protein RecO [Corynebacterium lowii]|uniref:DNA repair protein RecO n=1 Tax=Corynebacterium lowii TaxID=1544413 RepID=A0A0Q0YWW6_9CORY|nr:DNA repair protein RecO [Corynebacterium lowii]KQB86865.1 DNA repair protein RecO [Corynebacterium lowii]MDP9851553.1 DNA repair protein RecO (recombination protein O) [Corynebacterium lowii]
MRRPSYRDRAVVVRTYDFGEADRIVVLLTRGHGLVRAVAKGVRRAKSRFGSRVQLFVDLDVHLYPGRNLATLTGADTVAYYASGIIEDYSRYTAACAVVDCAERLCTAETGEDPFLFDAVVNTLAAMQKEEHPELCLDAFLLRAMGHAGWAPSLFACAQCGDSGPHHAFHPVAGGAVCVRCRPPGSSDVPPETLHAMWLLEHGHREAAQEIVEKHDLADQVHRLTSLHLQHHVEQRIGTLVSSA